MKPCSYVYPTFLCGRDLMGAKYRYEQKNCRKVNPHAPLDRSKESFKPTDLSLYCMSRTCFETSGYCAFVVYNAYCRLISCEIIIALCSLLFDS